MNESDTRLHKIDPQLKAAGWGIVDGSRITTEYTFTRGKISQTMEEHFVTAYPSPEELWKRVYGDVKIW